MKVRTICPFCGSGCGLYAVVEDRKIRFERRKNHPIAEGVLCPKGTFARKIVYHEKRLKKPLIRRGSKLVEASRNEALKLVAERIKEAMKDDPNRVGFFASAKVTNEENYLIQKLARAVVGTNNVDHCVRLCHAPSAAGLLRTVGSGAMTNPIDDVLNAKTVLVAGYNPFNTHPAIFRRMTKAKRNGTKFIFIDPRKSRSARLADIHLQPYPGTDVVLLNAMAKAIIDNGRIDEEFIKSRTVGFEEYTKGLEKYTLEYAEKVTGVPKELILKAAELYATNKPSVIYRGMGITQHVSGTQNVIALVMLALLTGNVGKPGTGLCPARGQSNVQGACDLGCMPNMFPGYMPVNEENARYYSSKRNAEVPSEPGLVTWEMIDAASRGSIDVLYIIGENPAISEPDSEGVRRKLQNASFLVVQDILMTDTAELADVVLPAATRLEKEGSMTNTERRVQYFYKALDPLYEAKSDFEILVRLAKLLGAERNYSSPRQVTDEIAEVVPIYRGITYEVLEKNEAGVIRPYDPKTGKSERILYAKRFKTPDGKARFILPKEVYPEDLKPSEEYPFLLISYRLLEHRNTGATTHIIPELHRLSPEPRVVMNPKDAERLGLKENTLVYVESRRGKVRVKLKVSNEVREGVVAMPYHFRETNVVVPHGFFDEIVKMPNFKGVPVKVYA